MTRADVGAAQESSFEALREAGQRYGFTLPVLDDEVRRRAVLRFEHLLRTDPEGCWVAEGADGILGVGMALRRESLWFLSLLTVSLPAQSRGLGGRLLAATLRTAAGASAGMIVSSPDPKALRRYGLAGFDLLPGLVMRGSVDRSLLPTVRGVREGDLTADAELVDEVGRALRGAGYGPDLGAYREQGQRLLVTDQPDGRGFAVLRHSGLGMLGASTEAAATRLLWSALAEAAPDAALEIDMVTATQQWAVRVALAARLSLTPADSLCVRGHVGPLTPYLPGGAYG